MAVSPFDYEATLHACAAGKQNALRDLFQHEAPHMLALSTKMFGRREEAEDAVRDAFILVWKNAGSYDESAGPARAWIHSILRYRVLNQMRQQSHNPGDDTLSVPPRPDVKDCLSTPVKSLAHLDEAQRAPLLMAFYYGQTFNQMATRLTTPVERIRAQLRTGLDAVQGRHA